MTGPWTGSGQFASLDEGGQALAELLVGGPQEWRGDDPGARVVVVGVVPNGVPAAVRVAAALRVPLVGIELQREADDVVVPALELPDCEVLVLVDDAVETGTAAAAVGEVLRAVGALRAPGGFRTVLAVPVCPRESEAAMGRRFDAVVAVVRPLARRALTWHYPGFESLDPTAGRALVQSYEASRKLLDGPR